MNELGLLGSWAFLVLLARKHEAVVLEEVEVEGKQVASGIAFSEGQKDLERRGWHLIDKCSLCIWEVSQAL